jgi:drug/metabolite transporter (DMT)-like permease
LTAIALALGASICWGVGDFLGGFSSRRLPALTVLAVAEVAGLAAIALYVGLRGLEPPGGEAFVLAGGAGVAGALGLGALYRGMAVGAMGVVAPISAVAAVIPVAFGLARGERPSGLQLAGIAAALVGVALASREPGETARLAAGVGLALVAAAGFGSYIVLIDEAAEASAEWAVLASRGAASVAAVSVALAFGRMRLRARALPALAVIGLFDVGANGLLALALTKGLISLVAVLSSLYPVVTIALARAVLGERIGRIQAAGAATALAGVALISAGS